MPVAALVAWVEAEGDVTMPELAARLLAERGLKDQGHAWNQGQREATRAMLLSTAAVNGLQGSAGTAKTTTVLKTFADAARAQGFKVRALAPTATAADVLGARSTPSR